MTDTSGNNKKGIKGKDMQEYKEQKEMRKAINAKMLHVMCGALMLLDAVTHVLLYAMSYFNYASEMSKGNQELIAQAEEIGLSASNIRIIALMLLILAGAQILVGFIALRFNNRLDKGNLIFRSAVLLMVLQIAAHLVIILNGLTMIEILFIGVMLAGCLIWSSIGFLKLAKAYPDKVWAVEPEKRRDAKHFRPGTKKSAAHDKKGIMDRAKRVKQEEE